jgi:hypothetical protein
MQGTGTLTNGTTNGIYTYMDDSPANEWATADADMTGSDDGTYYKVGSNSLKVAIVTAASAGDVITAATVTDEDWSARESVGFWLYSTIALTSGQLDFRVTDGTEGNTDIDIPAISAATWTWVELDITDVSGMAVNKKDDVDVISFIYTADVNTMDLYVDFVALWDEDEETDLDEDILKDGMLKVEAQDKDEDGARTWSGLDEYTDYFINYANDSGNGNLVVMTDQSDDIVRTLYAFE